ncbi:hypothetical protein GGR57DRAFT_479897 [Xylariaceae sp. FL1272]|nr:hypothetical protein GGR57DRAFT_479897 [Xylariaceae sp. FL1272]
MRYSTFIASSVAALSAFAHMIVNVRPDGADIRRLGAQEHHRPSTAPSQPRQPLSVWQTSQGTIPDAGFRRENSGNSATGDNETPGAHPDGNYAHPVNTDAIVSYTTVIAAVVGGILPAVFILLVWYWFFYRPKQAKRRDIETGISQQASRNGIPPSTAATLDEVQRPVELKIVARHSEQSASASSSNDTQH